MVDKTKGAVGDGLDHKVEEQEPVQAKVVLIGGTAVGKTSIFLRVINQDFIDEQITTLTAYYRSKLMSVPGYDRKIKINLWDTAGQEKFMSLTSQYVKGAQGVILVYDTTYSESLDSIKEWHKLLCDIIDPENLVIALVGNKCDDINRQEVALRDAKKVKDEIKAQIFHECSAKDNINIDKLFDDMAKLLMQKVASVSVFVF